MPVRASGQQANQLLADAARDVGTGWSYLPYQVTHGLEAWQKASATYGTDQGFTVRK
ncbi:hypothetical protein AB0D54_25700 [Streptomyces xanthophaeus]|uniref:hypothetical protein n=1 Tax=Streptomyces xanthophaeus TaxID=67385 RepID=UPI003435A633